MLQANKSNIQDGEPSPIMKRLKELTKWQEEQQKLLQERQSVQRRQLSLEQQSLYEKLGLVYKNRSVLKEGLQTSVLENKENITDEREVPTVRLAVSDADQESDDEGLSWPLDAKKALVQIPSKGNIPASGSFAPVEANCKPKRPFLKRGEGLKQRFKIDPETLRLNNLPRYKYSNAHPKIGKQKTKVTKQQTKQYKPAAKDGGTLPRVEAEAPIDFQEKRFQQLLISSKHTCNSTPDTKSVQGNSTAKSSPDVDTHQCSTSADLPTMPVMSWAEVLQSEQIRPISVREIRAAGLNQKYADDSDVRDSEISVFELLEQKANEGTIDMNSNCIKRLLARDLCNKLDAADEIPVDECLKDAKIKPDAKDLVDGLLNLDGESSDDSISESKGGGDEVQLCVRVKKGDTSRRYIAEVDPDDSTLIDANLNDDDISNTDLFMQFKEALFSALQRRAEHASVPGDPSVISTSGDNAMEPNAMPPLATELQEKANMIKSRLAELDNEIATFKRSNLELMKAKQEHELEKAELEQQRIMAMDEIKDEKIRIEMYLHDERMKLEEEKRRFEQQMRIQKSNSRERREIARLNAEIEEIRVQLKQKEHLHVSAQTRLRVQIKNLERDQKQLQEELNRMTTENTKLYNANTKIARENSNKMLHEINRNIAKLAPKLQTQQQQQQMPVGKEESIATAKGRRSPAPTQKPGVRKSTSSQPIKASKHAIDVPSKSTIKSKSRTQDRNSSDSMDLEEDEIVEDKSWLEYSLDFEHDDHLDYEQCLHSNNKVERAKRTHNKVPERADRMKESEAAFKRELINADGSKDIWYPNGNLKKISADGMIIRMLYFNKDIKETNINEGTVKYYYAETNTWHTTYLDGLEILEFPNGQIEHRHKDGTVEVHFPNSAVKITRLGDDQVSEEWRYSDGSSLTQMHNGDKIILFANGQKEIHTKQCKRREYPDGTVKTVYPDGSTETRYCNGRVRFKDKDGTLLMDTENN